MLTFCQKFATYFAKTRVEGPFSKNENQMALGEKKCKIPNPRFIVFLFTIYPILFFLFLSCQPKDIKKCQLDPCEKRSIKRLPSWYSTLISPIRNVVQYNPPPPGPQPVSSCKQGKDPPNPSDSISLRSRVKDCHDDFLQRDICSPPLLELSGDFQSWKTII